MEIEFISSRSSQHMLGSLFGNHRQRNAAAAAAAAAATATAVVEPKNISLDAPAAPIAAMRFGAAAASTVSAADKALQNIRVCLNKVSIKNATTQMQALCALLQQERDEASRLHNALCTVVDIAAANKFFVETFADIVTELMQIYPESMPDIVRTKFDEYRASFGQIKYIDPNVDYDGFCAFNKRNEIRRAQTLFFVHLNKKHNDARLMTQVLADIAAAIQSWFETTADNGATAAAADRLAEMEELVQHVSLICAQGVVADESTLATLRAVAALKIGGSHGLSSRVIFAVQSALKGKL